MSDVVPSHRRRRVLLLAPYLDRDDVGESWSNWQWTSGLSRVNEVTVLTTRRRGQSAIAPTLPSARVIEWSDPPLLRRFERFDSMLKPGFVQYYLRARRWITAALAAGEHFDVVHQLAPLAMRYPCPATGLAEKLVIGPIGGSLDAPEGLNAGRSRRPWFVKLRELDRLRFRHDPLLRRSYSEADCVIGVAPYVAKVLAGIPIRRMEFASETGVSELPGAIGTREHGGPLRLLYVGRVVRTKGLRDAVRAVAIAASWGVDLRLDAVGDGEDWQACRAEAVSLGVGHLIDFHGKRPRAELDRFYREADAFLFPSFREPSGNVVLEAMSYGLPLIVSDVGGPGYVVRDSFGIRVPVGSGQQFEYSLANAIVKLRDGRVRQAMGASARGEVEVRYLWGTKVAWMCSLYESLLHEECSRAGVGVASAASVGRGVERRSLDPVAEA
jgi:glycosyltransferase involved in cell wall biosynthesis